MTTNVLAPHNDITVKALARVIYCEGRGEPFIGKTMIGMVVINESIISGYPVITVAANKDRYSGAGCDIQPDKESIREYNSAYIAAKYALRINWLPMSVQFFHNPKTGTDTRWIKKISKYTYARVGNHIFCHNPNYIQTCEPIFVCFL